MKQRKIYVASSWRNEFQPAVVDMLRTIGHEVYDFRNPPNGSGGFAWSDIDENWINLTSDEYKGALEHPIAIDGFNSDFEGMKWADTCVMVLPCGRSANTEAGWMKGAGKEVYVLTPIKQEPELMYKIYDGIITSMDNLKKTFSICPPLSNFSDDVQPEKIPAKDSQTEGVKAKFTPDLIRSLFTIVRCDGAIKEEDKGEVFLALVSQMYKEIQPSQPSGVEDMQERKFTLKEALEIWDPGQDYLVDVTDVDRKQYFKDKFNIEL